MRSRERLYEIEDNYRSGCVIIFLPKYQNRQAPSYPAKNCKGKYRYGNNGKLYKSVKNKKGVYRWKKY